MSRYTALYLILGLLVLFSCGGEPPSKSAKSSETNELKQEKMEEEEILTEEKAEEGTEQKEVENAEMASESAETEELEEEPVDPKHLEKAKELIESVSDREVAGVDAKKKFRMLCASCHGFKGNMMVNGAKDLTKSKISLQESVAQVYFGKGLMTPFKGVMEDEEIVAVCKYVETLR